jgi:hypothetical protein
MLRLAALCLPVLLALPAQAGTLLSEVSGNWAGASGQGFTFIARLSQEDDMARLQVWNAAPDAVPTAEGDPALDNAGIALGAFATRQELEVIDTSDGLILQIVTEFTDEEAEGRTVVQIRYLDNQFTVTGFFHGEVSHGYAGVAPVAYECDLDLLQGVAKVDGVERALPAMPFEELNASGWSFGAAFDRGYCSVD